MLEIAFLAFLFRALFTNRPFLAPLPAGGIAVTLWSGFTSTASGCEQASTYLSAMLVFDGTGNSQH
jgi:hypothetical protein